MITISKAEAQELRKMFPDAEFVRTMRTESHRGKYYLTESRKVLAALAKLRNVDVKSITE